MRLIRNFLLVSVLVFSLSAREQVNVNFSNLQIHDFIKLISKITNKNILINHKVNGTVDFISTTPIYDDELIGILISVLESKGYTLVKKGSLYEVVRSTDVAKHNTSVMKEGTRVGGSLMVTQAIRVQDENVDIVAAKIRYLISKTAKLMTMKESNTILVTDYPKNIETIKKVIKDLVADKQIIVKVIKIEKTEAKQLQIKLVDIIKSMFNEKISSQKTKVILDENINSLLVVGNTLNVTKIEKLIKKLDVESNVNNGVKIFELKNSDAKSVLKSLNEIISKQVYKDPSMKPNVSASEEINAIIAIGDPLIVKGIKMIIDELDKEKYQVYVQARVVEINKNNSKDLGLKWGFDGANVVSNGGLYSFSTNFGGSSITSAAASLITMPTDLTGGFSLGAALDFLEANGASKALSNPSILCVNNKESSIYVGKTISVSTGSVTNSTVSGVTNSYKREDVGLTLKIKPRVSSSDKVTLDVEVSLENVLDDGTNNASGQPVTSKQEVKTQAILRHGENIIIGGLVKNYDRESLSKIPFLGDIPFLGEWLFSSTTNSVEQDNLVVILTPYIIDESAKLSQLQRDLGVLAKLQKEYNVDVFNDLKKLKEESK
ncbi:MAG: secretin N-terminal domain-containing protein [Campylobacterota bacterium]|nr:secretin N-terminal domain-containing protein [Campylobacterota bacterium]